MRARAREFDLAGRRKLTGQQRLLILDSWVRSKLAAHEFASLCGVSAATLYAWKRRFEAVLEVEQGETVRIGELAIRVVPAEHKGDRGPFGASAAAVGYVVTGSSSVYFAGDTDLFDGMRELGPVDLALIPIWGWGPGLGAGHLDPARAADAVALVRPRVVVPIHWGTYFPIHLGMRRQPGFVKLPPAQFLAALERAAPDVEARVLAPGEGTEL